MADENKDYRLGIVIVVALYTAMIVLTKPLDLGDTIFYVDPIVAMANRPSVATLRQSLDFGHLLWRPLGWLCYEGVRLVGAGAMTATSQRAAVARALIGIDMVAGAAATVMLYDMGRRLGFRNRVAIITCAAFVGSNAVVNLAHAGSSYMLALALLLGACSLVLFRERVTTGAAVAGGALLALSVTIWFPFVLVTPAVLLGAFTRWSTVDGQPALRPVDPNILLLVGTALATGVTIFGAAVVVLHIHDGAGLMQWIRDSAHGWRQRSTLLRLAIGLPRCCFALGDTGLLWKRYFLRDPFAPVTQLDLIRGSIASVVYMTTFYVSMGFLGWRLLRQSQGRAMLVMLVAAASPVLFFAVALFEPSSIERFTPAFPLLFLAWGLALEFAWPHTRLRAAALLFPAAMIVSTATSYADAIVARHWRPAIARLQVLRQRVPPGSTVALLSNQDVVDLYARNDPLRDTLSTPFTMLIVVRPANESIFCWQRSFASRVLADWSASREVWVSMRVLSPAPRPDWNWAEGDDPSVQWHTIPEFFRQFRFDAATGDSDGFARLAQVPANGDLMHRLADAPCQHPGVRIPPGAPRAG